MKCGDKFMIGDPCEMTTLEKKEGMEKSTIFSACLLIFWLFHYMCTNIYLSLFVALAPLGGLLNDFAYYRNKGVMPVYWPNSIMQGMSDGKHVIETDKSKIRCFYLCDIIHLPRIAVSVGDIVSTVGACAGVYLIVALCFML